jgi:hypothetical protein
VPWWTLGHGISKKINGCGGATVVGLEWAVTQVIGERGLDASSNGCVCGRARCRAMRGKGSRCATEAEVQLHVTHEGTRGNGGSGG